MEAAYEQLILFRLIINRMGNADIIGIVENTLELIMDASLHRHPNEFFAYLRAVPAEEIGIDEDGSILSEVVLMPGTSSSPFSATIPEYAIPIGGRSDGSVHSHPNGVLQPSDTDLQNFSHGNIHIIVASPYRTEDWKALDADGNEIQLKVFDVELPKIDEEW